MGEISSAWKGGGDMNVVDEWRGEQSSEETAIKTIGFSPSKPSNKETLISDGNIDKLCGDELDIDDDELAVKVADARLSTSSLSLSLVLATSVSRRERAYLADLFCQYNLTDATSTIDVSISPMVFDFIPSLAFEMWQQLVWCLFRSSCCRQDLANGAVPSPKTTELSCDVFACILSALTQTRSCRHFTLLGSLAVATVSVMCSYLFSISHSSRIARYRRPYLLSSAVAAVFSIRSASALSAPSMLASVSDVSFRLNNPSLLPAAENLNSDEKTFNVVNPGSRDGLEVITKCRVMDLSDAKTIIESSAAALPSWRDETNCLHRSKILAKWSESIKDNLEDVATIMTTESGKPLAESKGEVVYACSFLDYYAGEALRPTSAGGGFIAPTTFATPEGAPRGQIMAIHEAVGVCGMITPFNFPAAMVTRKVGPALAAGCTAVVKPSELTPLTAIALCELGKKAGIPDGVFELIVADATTTPDVGAELCSNPIVKKVSFTGSVAVGKLLARQSASTVKKVSLELGGNAPFIVFDDADLDVAVSSAIASKFRHAGQTCVCADRFLVHNSVHDEFTSKFVAAVEQFKVDQGMNEGTTMGPLITQKAAKSVEAKVQEAVAEGGKCLTGGSALTEVGANFFQPTIITNVATNSRLWKEETFGPVAAIRSFDTEEEAIELANDCSVGLASYFCSKDLSRVFRVARRIETGIVGINDGIISTASAPFGGVKESGLGREGSAMGLGEYLETKYVFVNA